MRPLATTPVVFRVLVTAAFLLTPQLAKAQAAYGDDFLVTDDLAASYPDAAMDESGNFVVVWEGIPVGSLPVIWGQRFWADGLPRGDAFQISTYSRRHRPRVAMARDGRFVVAWVSEVTNPVEARAFASDGTYASAELAVTDKWIGLMERPVDVAIADDGDFIVVWDTSQSPDPTADQLDILGQLFLADGTPDGGLIYVNSHTTGIQKHPRVAMNNEGRKVAVTWDSRTSPGDDASLGSVIARAFDNGLPVGLDFQVNQSTSGEQRNTSIDMNIDPDNRFVIAWESKVTGGDLGIFARRYQVNGTPEENERRIDGWPYGFFLNQVNPTAAITSQRDILVAWESSSTLSGDDLDRCIEGRAFYFDGTWSDQHQVNTTVADPQYNPAMDSNDRGDYVVAWQDMNGLWARRFLEVGPIFGDGFETGDASSWSTP